MPEMSPEQVNALKAQVGPMLDAFGLDLSLLDKMGDIADEFSTVKRTVRILATWVRMKDPDGFEKCKKVILDAEAKEDSRQ